MALWAGLIALTLGFWVILTMEPNLLDIGRGVVELVAIVSEKLVALAVRLRVPLAGGWGAWARAGGLLSYGPNLDQMIRHAADYTVKILNGAKPADLPVQQPTAFELIINLGTAKALALPVPASLLARADEVID